MRGFFSLFFFLSLFSSPLSVVWEKSTAGHCCLLRDTAVCACLGVFCNEVQKVWPETGVWGDS